jgi:hypothetical protein
MFEKPVICPVAEAIDRHGLFKEFLACSQQLNFACLIHVAKHDRIIARCAPREANFPWLRL